jgi:hypothetical protein
MTTNNWKEEFDKKFVTGNAIADYIDGKELNASDIKSFISQLLEKKDEEYLQWFRDFSTAMALENIKMPKDLKDVNAVNEGIRNALKRKDDDRLS